MKRKIKVKFVDFYQGFDPEKSFFMECLRRNYDIEYSDDPEYLFFSSFGLENLDYSQCVKIFYSGENNFPDFNLCDYALGFELIDVMDRYLRMPTYYQTLYKDEFASMLSRTEFSESELKNKTGFCSFVYSNANADPIRPLLFNTLSSYKQVASGGRFMNNIGGPCESKIDFEKNYKFSISVENVAYPGYTTEKLMQAFAAHTIPIYWGDPKVTDVFNPKAFIHVRDYDSVDAVLERIRELDENDDKYIEMMKQPPLLDEKNTRENALNRLTDYFSYIIEQDIDSAKRFSRLCWNKLYTESAIERRDALEREKRNIFCRIRRKVTRMLSEK